MHKNDILICGVAFAVTRNDRGEIMTATAGCVTIEYSSWGWGSVINFRTSRPFAVRLGGALQRNAKNDVRTFGSLEAAARVAFAA